MMESAKNQGVLGRFTEISKGGRWLFVIVVALPSLLLILGAPPLWRDSDGWAQLTGKPNVLTLLQWPPAYCFGARVPLWIGTEVGALLGQGAWAQSDFFYRPNITDGGVYGVVVAQHLLLVITLVVIIAGLTANGWIRLALGLIAAGQIPLYIYAQTVGSETLSALLTLAFLAAAYFLVMDKSPRTWWRWGVVGGLLFLLISTRHVNAVFCSVLPLYYLISMGVVSWRGFSSDSLKQAFKGFGLSLMLGIVVLLAAQAASAVLCRMSGVPFRSCLGSTFQWRLMDFASLDAGTRGEVWAAVLPSLEEVPELRKVIVEQAMTNDEILGTVKLGARVRDAVDAAYPQEANSRIKYRSDLQMNEFTKKFILHAGMPYWRIVAEDWAKGFSWTLDELAWEPFATTHYFSWPANTDGEAAKGLRHLRSFQWFEKLGPEAAYQQTLYLRLITGQASVGALLLAGVLCAGALLVAAPRRSLSTALYMIACILSALLLWWMTKMLTHDMPRFVLPLYTTGVFVFLLGLAEVAKLLPVPPVPGSQKSSA